MILRDPTEADEAGWRELWAGYLAFYEASIPEAVTAATWRRLIDPEGPIFGRLAEGEDGVLLGLCHCILHEGTWSVASCCYLEDLFVRPEARGTGIGRALIEDALALARAKGWARLYWHTRDSNATARRLYDRFGEADGFVRYRLFL